jgi:2-iminobutanoate/2-iminopropanoate deaminase
MMTRVTTDNAPAAIGPYSQAIKANGFIFTSGQIPLTPAGELVEGDIHDQTRQVLTNLSAVLEAAGSSLQNIVKTTIYLTNMDDFIAVNTIYAEFFGTSFPARSTVAVKTLPKNVDIEIDAVALDLGQEYHY